MQLDTMRFGTISINDEKILSFNDGIPGLEEHKRFVVLHIDNSYPILWLQSIEDGDICLPVLDTYSVLTEYAFDIEDEDVEELGVSTTEELHIVNVLVIPDNLEDMTINLAAPIVINTTKKKAKQIILNRENYSTRIPVFADIYKMLKGDEDASTISEGE